MTVASTVAECLLLLLVLVRGFSRVLMAAAISVVVVEILTRRRLAEVLFPARIFVVQHAHAEDLSEDRAVLQRQSTHQIIV